MPRIAVVAVFAVVLAVGTAAPAIAAFPGRNGWIAFVEECCSGSDLTDYYIGLLAPDGSRGRETNEGGVNPAFSPDGSRIVYASGFDFGLTISRVDGRGRPRRITRKADYAPAWAPGGKSIVFVRTTYSDTEYTADLRIRSRGKGRLLMRDAGCPSWSVRNWIAFCSIADDGIWAIRPNGKGRHRILDHGLPEDWSPDGRRLVLTHRGVVRTVRADGTGVRTLRRGSSPAYSPDGRKIVYLGRRGLLYIMGSDGRNPHRIPHPRNMLDPEFDILGDPAWQPLPLPGRTGSKAGG